MARPAAVVSESFRSDAALNARYHEVEPRIIGLIHSKANKWAAKFPGDAVDDLVQEGRCALLAALPKYDPTIRPLHVYVGMVLDNAYNRILRDLLAQKRIPHVWEHDEDTDEWKRVPCPTLHYDAMGEWEPAAHNESPEEEVAYRRRVGEGMARLHSRLTPIERQVLECYVHPAAGLLATARNLSGGYKANTKHIAVFLGIPRTKVEHTVRKIRAEAGRVAAGMED